MPATSANVAFCFPLLIRKAKAADAAVHACIDSPADKTQKQDSHKRRGPGQQSCGPTRLHRSKLNRNIVLAKLFDQPLTNRVTRNRRLKRRALIALNCQRVAFDN